MHRSAIPGDRDALLAHPDAIALPVEQIVDGSVFVAERDGAIAGFAAVVARPDGGAELDALFVEPHLWKHGIGRRLVEHVADVARTRSATFLHVIGTTYAELFGWTTLETLDLGPERGRHVTFSWDGTTEAVGSVSNLARLLHVHSQWLFFFPTENLADSLARVRTSGGLTLPVVETAEGNLVAPCEDPQGAAFGLHQVMNREAGMV